MKSILVNHSDINGGAARAAYRIHHALRCGGVDSIMTVNVAASGDWTVRGPKTKKGKVAARVRQQLGALAMATFSTDNPIIHSPAVLPSSWPKRLNTSDADVLHLHWVAGEMMSIADVGRLRKPVVWTLHDMWAFCGAEHYTEDERWLAGYTRWNRPAYESGFDLNRWTWRRKQKHWRRPMHIVAPSRWLAECAQQSPLIGEWPVTVVPNPIDTERWAPLPKGLARELLGLPADVPVLLFGAIGGGRDPRKGFDLLQAALEHMRGSLRAQGMALVVFGQLAPENAPDLGFPMHYTGHLHDDLTLRAVYSAADALVVPSRQEAFGQTASEAHACGTPVVAFGNTGLRDVVAHQETGYLARAFETADLAKGIQWVIEDQERNLKLGRAARERAKNLWSYDTVAAQYLDVYSAAVQAAEKLIPGG